MAEAEASPVELNAVQLPAAVPLGGKFTAKVWATRAGKRVGVNKDF